MASFVPGGTQGDTKLVQMDVGSHPDGEPYSSRTWVSLLDAGASNPSGIVSFIYGLLSLSDVILQTISSTRQIGSVSLLSTLFSLLNAEMVSIFAKLRAGRKAAQQQPGPKDPPVPSGATTPYRHVPTHSFADALAGTPGSYRDADRRKIREGHRRRSIRIASIASDSVGSSTYQAAGQPSGGLGSGTMVERGLLSQKARLVVDRGEANPQKSPLSSMGTVGVSAYQRRKLRRVRALFEVVHVPVIGFVRCPDVDEPHA
ncbi:MAG: hypothetical protein M1823_005352 [Watsoniomyces obsoletus]|nr:MAG: hypothetical protein M1823_005352 [Watsoniomyces obsoletus]